MAGISRVPVILDTNVVFSALGRRRGAPAQVLEWALTGRVVASAELLEEYRRVLEQPRALDFSGLSIEQVTDFLVSLRSIVDLRRPSGGPPCPDPGDQHLWDLLHSVPAAILVTGETRLVESSDFTGRVVSPRTFLDRFVHTTQP